MTSRVIGISGKTGAGKSTLAKILAESLNATVISWDEFDDVSTEPSDYMEMTTLARKPAMLWL